MSESVEEIRPADISYILNHPWEVSRQEWGLESHEDKIDIRAYIEHHLDLSTKDGFFRIWRTPEGETIGMLGCYEVEDKIYEAFFFASKHMNTYGIKLTLELRRLLKDLSVNFQGCKCRLFSASDHPKQISWFRILGFEYMPNGNMGKARYFEYMVPS